MGGKEVPSANRNVLSLPARPIVEGGSPHFVQLLLIRLGHRTLHQLPDPTDACFVRAEQPENLTDLPKNADTASIAPPRFFW